jgi:O-antigen ligase
VLALVFLALGTRRWWLVLPLAAVGAAAAFGLVALLWPTGFERIVSLAAMAGDLIATGRIAEVSGGERQMMYQAGIAAILDAPLFGYGWGQRLTAIAPYLPQGLDSFAQVHHHLHSDSLDFGVSAGALGLLAYILTLAAPVIGAWASPRDRQFRFRLLGCIGLSLAYLIFGLSYLTFGYEYHTTLYVCLTAILLGYCREPAGA